MSNANAAATNEAATNEAGDATTKFKRYNYRGTMHILGQGAKDGKSWCKFTLKGADGKKKVEVFAYGDKAEAALRMSQEAGKDKLVNVFGYFNPNNTRTFTNRKGENVTVRQLQALAVNWPLPAKAKADAVSEESAPAEVASQPALETAAAPSAATDENPFE